MLQKHSVTLAKNALNGAGQVKQMIKAAIETKKKTEPILNAAIVVVTELGFCKLKVKGV